jgi:serine/threonine protein phosphatase 1
MILARPTRENIVCLRGNPEIMFESYLGGRMNFDFWRSLRGLETLMSYRIDPKILKQAGPIMLAEVQAAVPDNHKKFLAQTRLYVELGSYCFVHAGLRPKIPIGKQSPNDLTMIRREFLDYDGSFGCIVVHGHTPHPHVDYKHNRINVDTGAYATNKLSAIRIDEAGPSTLTR